MSKHTKGPWRVGKTGAVVSDHTNGVPESGGWRDVDYYGGNLIAESVVHPANAHLIAAAPSLLSALEAVEWGGIACGSPLCPACHSSRDRGHSERCTLHAALLLARGEAVVRSTSETTSPHTKDPR